MLAIVLKLLLQPVVRACERVHVPRLIGALLATVLLLTVFVGLGYLVSGPASSWMVKLPTALPPLKEKLHFLAMPIDAAEQVLSQLQGGVAAVSPGSSGVPVRAPGLFDTLFSSTKAVAAGFFTMLVVLVYLLVSGETFLRRFVEILPRFKDKRRAVEISMHIERDISAYLMTITIINAVVGIATTGVMVLCGVEPTTLGHDSVRVELRSHSGLDCRSLPICPGRGDRSWGDLVGTGAGRIVFCHSPYRR